MKMHNLILLLLFFSLPVHAVDQLGRLFTTPAERSMLQDMRISKPGASEHLVTQFEEVSIKDVSQKKDAAATNGNEFVSVGDGAGAVSEEETFLEDDELEEVEEMELLKEPLQLKGIVSRKKGNNTVWINDNNSYEGGLIKENITVQSRSVHKDSVMVKLPDDKTNISLKVGETYTPETIEAEN